MGTYRQTFLYNFSTLVTFLTGETRVHSNDLMTSSCSLIFKNVEECTPRGIENALGQVLVFHHVGDLKVFDRNHLIVFGIAFRGLEMVIAALAIDLQVGLGDVTSSFPSPVTTFLASTQLSLLASQGLLRSAIETWVRNSISLRVSQEDFQAHVNPDSGMRTDVGFMLLRWLSFTDDQSVPMPIGTANQVNRLRDALYGTMQLDLEEVTELLRHNEVFLVIVQIAILAILSELDGMPAIGRLEPRETNASNIILLGNEKAFEGLGQSICQHLYHRGGQMVAVSFEGSFKLVLAEKCAMLLILCFDRLQHRIVNAARLSQAGHELAGLFLIHEQPIFKRSHVYILMQPIRIFKVQGYTQPLPKLRNAFFTAMSEARGPQRQFLVEKQFFVGVQDHRSERRRSLDMTIHDFDMARFLTGSEFATGRASPRRPRS